MDLTPDQDELVPACIAAPARAALRLAPASFMYNVRRLMERQRRCKSPRPGAAAGNSAAIIGLDGGEHVHTWISVTKATMREGGHIEVVITRNNVTLCGDILRILDDELPDTIMDASVGRRVGDLIDVGGASVFSLLADVGIIEASRVDGVQTFRLATDDVGIALREIGAQHPGYD